jgi:galactonate dehydratase
MTKISRVRSLEILACDAGWRDYHFVKITTDDGIVGWSEFDEGFGSPGVGTATERLSARVVGQNGSLGPNQIRDTGIDSLRELP